MEMIVYYDENYPTWWVSREVSKKIVSYLKSKGFSEYNADDLAIWMKKSIDENRCHESVVVFSQDIVPETICYWWSPSSLIRTYLDSGGRVVWIGDSPFYYSGRHSSRSSEFQKWSEDKKRRWGLLENRNGNYRVTERDGSYYYALTWDTDGSFNTLGVMPTYMDSPRSKVKTTEFGKAYGIQSLWYGLRPILIRASDCRKKNITVLARASLPEHGIPKKKAWMRKISEESGIPLPSFFGYLSKTIGLTPAVIALVSAVYTLFAGFSLIVPMSFLAATVLFSMAYVAYWVFWRREIFVSAWLRNYDSRHPASGFLRIWDCHLERITDKMLEELFNVALAKL